MRVSGAFMLAYVAFADGIKEQLPPSLVPAEPVIQSFLQPLLSGSLFGRQVCGPQGNCGGNHFSSRLSDEQLVVINVVRTT